MNAVLVNGEHFCSIAAKDKTDAVRVKTNAAREDWKNIMSSLHNRETSLQVSTEVPGRVAGKNECFKQNSFSLSGSYLILS